MYKKLFLVILALVFAFIIAELYLRLTSPKDTLSYTSSGTFPCYRPGTVYWAEIKPNATCTLHSNFSEFKDITIRTNSLGLRNDEVSSTKPKDVKRILFIGDSFTFGWGVEKNQSYPQVTEQILKNTGLKIESIDAGRPSNSPGNYYLYLVNNGLKLDPDFIIIGFDVINELSSHNETWMGKDKSGLPTKIGNSTFYVDPQGNLRGGQIPLKYKIPVLSHSYLFSFLMDLLFPQKEYFDNKPSSTEEITSRLKLIYKTISAVLESRNKKLIVLMIPSSLQVDDDTRRDLRLPIVTSEHNFQDEEFMQFFKQNKMDYLNLLPDFLKSPDRNRLYYKKDGHLTIKGQKIAGELLAEKLKGYFK